VNTVSQSAVSFVVPIGQQELEGVEVSVEVDEQVAARLGHPRIAGMCGHARDADAAGGVLDDGRHVRGGAVEEIDGTQVGGQEGFGLCVQELCPGRFRSPRRPGDPGVGQDLPHCPGRQADGESGELFVDAAVAPAWVFPGQSLGQGLDVGVCRWPSGPLVSGALRLAAAEDVRPPAQHSVRCDDQSEACPR
jgi:hypothetical protein